MNVSLPTLGVCFDIEKVHNGDYGSACWRLFWRAVEVSKLAGASLFEGDTIGQENVYCLVLQSQNRTLLAEVRAALETDPEIKKVAASRKFLEDSELAREPLISAGRVEGSGNVVGGYNAREALESVKNEKLH